MKNINDSHTSSCPDISDHRLVRCKAKLSFVPSKTKTTRKRFNIAKLSDSNTQAEFSKQVSELLTEVRNDSSIQELADSIQKTLLHVSDDVLGKPPKKESPPCLSETTIKSIKEKHDTRKKHGHKSIEYKLHKSNVKKMVRTDKLNNIDREHLELRDLPPDAKYYELIKRMKLSREKKVKGWGIKSKDNKILSNTVDILERWQEFYATLYFENDDVFIPLPENDYPIPPIIKSEVQKAINMLKKNKAPGPDDIVTKMLKHGGEILVDKLLTLYNKMIELRETPTQMRLSEIVTLFKKGDLLDCGNYRPITLLSHLYKLLMQIIYNRVSNTLAAALPKSQAAYQKGRNTIEQIQSIQQIIEKSREFNRPLVTCFIDFTKAFDSVKQSRLWHALNDYTDLDPSYINLLRTLYSDSKAFVRTEIGATEAIDILKGVKQGDLLSALLFCIALKVILEETFDGIDFGIKIGGNLENEKDYADDIALITTTTDQMNTLLDRLHRNALAFGLSINVKKTKVMFIGNHDNTYVTISGIKVDVVEEFEYLGRILSNDGDDSKAVGSRIGKAWGAFEKKKYIITDKRLPVSRKVTVYEDYILPVVLYASETIVWTKKNLSKMEVFQNHIMRWITGHRLQDKISIDKLRRKTKLHPMCKSIKKQKLRWFGHMKRSSLPVRDTFEGLIEGSRRRGRPSRRWRDDISEWVGKNWFEINSLAHSRERWKNLLNTF